METRCTFTVRFREVTPGSGNRSWDEITSTWPPGRISTQTLGWLRGCDVGWSFCLGRTGVGGDFAFGEQGRYGDHEETDPKSYGKRWELLKGWRAEEGVQGWECASDHNRVQGLLPPSHCLEELLGENYGRSGFSQLSFSSPGLPSNHTDCLQEKAGKPEILVSRDCIYFSLKAGPFFRE